MATRLLEVIPEAPVQIRAEVQEKDEVEMAEGEVGQGYHHNTDVFNPRWVAIVGMG